jgi:hypothetical protein
MNPFALFISSISKPQLPEKSGPPQYTLSSELLTKKGKIPENFNKNRDIGTPVSRDSCKQ